MISEQPRPGSWVCLALRSARPCRRLCGRCPEPRVAEVLCSAIVILFVAYIVLAFGRII